MSIPTVREYFFTHCNGFSMYFPTLLSAEGEAFRRECAARGKKITVWTVNDPEEMKECLRWGVQAVITDKPDVTVGLVEKVCSSSHAHRVSF
jgi:phosphatidylglycerol phospholipase C